MKADMDLRDIMGKTADSIVTPTSEDYKEDMAIIANMLMNALGKHGPVVHEQVNKHGRATELDIATSMAASITAIVLSRMIGLSIKDELPTRTQLRDIAGHAGEALEHLMRIHLTYSTGVDAT